ncbi:molybdenum ABC transporter ATP-binding protein [uncultured Martelella sp.]|uniref:molybdenum ABC transporter ATP-binding protein n=1 Tax=uncultured Martelella sp. TaxID=392331 RepID=UPI0029C98FBC|nr:molybdenum ABC transporter ATP-binding protein [uncultured Martelella sp.]
MSARETGLAARFEGHLGAFKLDVDLNFPVNGITALFGASGCGKTSLLRCFAGLNRLQAGHFAIDGEIWQDGTTFLPPHRRAVGYVFQQANLFPHLSVHDNLVFGLKRLGRTERNVAKGRFDQLVSLLGIDHLLERAPRKLSGGERQRVAIGRALLTAPKLLLMDEPLSALDFEAKREILPYLDGLRKTLSIPVLYVTHAPNEVARLADHIAVLENGRILASGPLTETLARLDLPIRREEGAGVAIDARIIEIDSKWHLARVAFSGGSLWVRDPQKPVGEMVRVMVLARDVSLALAPSRNVSIVNHLPAKVLEIADGDHPAVVAVKVDVGGTPLIARLTARSAAALALEPGKPVSAQIKSVAIVD